MVAEASRSLDLANNDRHDGNGDGLWVGCSRGPVAGTLCEVNPAIFKMPFHLNKYSHEDGFG